jgi:NAD+ kinase
MMAEKRLRFALFGKRFQDNKSTTIQKILACLQAHKGEAYFDRRFYDYLKDTLQLTVNAAGVFDDYNFDVDFVVSVGGDGTFLKAASRVGAKNTPIVGVNTGRLGFLSSILPSEIESAFDEIFRGDYQIEEHAVVQLSADGEPIEGIPFALNDIAVLKRDDASMISIRTCVNDEYLVTYQADGLIISTPTGSTAYSLSNGGPIMVPDARNLCITPVAPHSLNIRPIVINDDNIIQLEVESRSHNFLVAIDGRSEKLVEGTRLKIQKAPFNIKIVKRHNQRYFSTLREKMMWGADQR